MYYINSIYIHKQDSGKHTSLSELCKSLHSERSEQLYLLSVVGNKCKPPLLLLHPDFDVSLCYDFLDDIQPGNR